MRIAFSGCLVLCLLLVLETTGRGQAWSQQGGSKKSVHGAYRVPRVTALEAYAKTQKGRGIIIQAGGESYRNRHVMGAIDLHVTDVQNKKVRIPKLPKRGVEIFIYCY